MENINTMELNNNEEETVNDTVDTNDVIDTVLDTDEVIIAEVDSGDTFKTFVKICLVGGIALGIAIAANWDKIKDRQYKKLQKKLSKEAAKRGETVFITKCEYSETETAEESAEVEEAVEVAEN